MPITAPASTIKGTLKRLWDDLRTANDLLGELVGKEEVVAKEVENIGDGVDDIASRIYELSKRLKKG